MRVGLLTLWAMEVWVLHSQTSCHYTCLTCSSSQYYGCLTCASNRGAITSNEPISGMCYCINETDENQTGQCTGTNDFNYNNKAIISVFIGLSIFLGLVIALVTGMRYYLVKIIEDVQELSLLVFLNMYFPQQFDIYLTHLYRFNISSFTFESLTAGSLFTFEDNERILSTDGQNIYGKYKLLYKTANFFANQFTWLLVFVGLVVLGIIIRCVRNRMKKTEEEVTSNKNQSLMSLPEEKNKNSSLDKFSPGENMEAFKEETSKVNNNEPSKCYKFINKVYNICWLNFFIVFFYLSLIELNINIFAQVTNLTFSSGFAAFGALSSAFFMGLQFIILALLALKVKEEAIKPQWMRDCTYTAPINLIRTNYKSITKYFWFFCCLKKILIALMITVFYDDSNYAILAVSAVEGAFICFAVYCQPFQKRYLRLHFYFSEGLKLFMFVGLVNFSEKYVEYIRMIEMTRLLYILFAVIFGLNVLFILCNMFAQRKVYMRAIAQACCPDDPEKEQYLQGKKGYHSEGKIYIYQRQ